MIKCNPPTVVILTFFAAALSAGGCSATDTSSGPTKSPALVTSTAAASSSQTAAPAKPQVFKGNGSENIGTVNVPTMSTLRWSCPSCAHQNFTVTNSINDPGTITVNALGPSSGKTVLDAGTYHDVQVMTEGQAWTITVTAGT